MGLSFFYITKCQTFPLQPTYLNTIQTVKIWFLELGNIKRFWKKLEESEKN